MESFFEVSLRVAAQIGSMRAFSDINNIIRGHSFQFLEEISGFLSTVPDCEDLSQEFRLSR